MKTIVLPGFSPHNKEWAHEVKNKLLEFDVEVHEWRHWETGDNNDFSVENEISRLNLDSDANIIAKSIGTLVAVNLLKKYPEKINIIIFNGIPLNDLRPEDFDDYEVLKSIDLKKILFIQNASDPHATYDQINEFLAKINPEIKVLSKDRNDHEYPYWEDFRAFLS